MFGGIDHKSPGTMTPFLLLQHDKWFNQMFPVCIRTTLVSKNMFFISTGLGNVSYRPPSDYEPHSACTPIDDHQCQLCASLCPHTQKNYHTLSLYCWSDLIFSIDVHFFSQYIQSRCILQYFLEMYYYFWVLLSSLKPFKMFLWF